MRLVRTLGLTIPWSRKEAYQSILMSLQERWVPEHQKHTGHGLTDQIRPRTDATIFVGALYRPQTPLRSSKNFGPLQQRRTSTLRSQHSSQADICPRRNVRFGSKADIRAAISHVRFAPKSGHVRCTHRCLLSANSGHHEIAGRENRKTASLRFSPKSQAAIATVSSTGPPAGRRF